MANTSLAASVVAAAYANNENGSAAGIEIEENIMKCGVMAKTG
jgi:hypothetical protein